jgi:TolB-like protein/Flp pilus assembly protein TadD
VVRAVLGWGILSFAVLQIYEPVMHGLHLPEWTLTLVVVILGAGFPATFVLAWIFDMGPGGVERTPAAPGEVLTPARRVRTALLLIGLGLLISVPGWAWYARHDRARSSVPSSDGGSYPEKASPVVTGGPSIAVLPFADMSEKHDQEYFADGVAEEILNALAHVQGLRVPGRTSSFWFKGKNMELAEIGRKLNVTHLMEGSVRRAGKRLRVTAQVVNVADGGHVWSETFDRDQADIFAVQDEIASAVASALKLKLLPAPGSRDRRTASLEAHDLYLRGLYFWNLRTGDSLLRAAEFFKKATQADPTYALAYAGLADAIEVRSGYVWNQSDQLRTQAKAAALRALEIDPTLGEAHASLGIMLADELDWSGAIEHYRKAIALRPDYATAHQWYATALGNLGRADEARQEIDHALRLDPTSRVINTNAGSIATVARDYSRAERSYKAALDLAPDFENARSELAILYALLGRRAEALEEIGKVSPEGENRSSIAIVYAMTGRRQEAERIARELEETSKKEHVPAALLAPVWARLGDKDKAFAALRRVCQEREGAWLDSVKVGPMYDDLRSDPRFGEILDCLHLR